MSVDMTKKREERLRWALRYILCHPEMSPTILAEEWKISIDEAINICSVNFGTAVCDFGIGNGKIRVDNMEKGIFARLMELK